MKIKPRITIIIALVSAALFIAYFSTEPNYEVKEITKEVMLLDVKQKS